MTGYEDSKKGGAYRFISDPFCRDPDCLRCLRRKLRAVGVAVFFRSPEGWRIGNYQGDKPSAAAEVEFECLLRARVPDVVAAHSRGLILCGEEELQAKFGSVSKLFRSCSVIAAHVQGGESSGVRLAWRDDSEPYEEEDLATIKCSGECPDGCQPRPFREPLDAG